MRERAHSFYFYQKSSFLFFLTRHFYHESCSRKVHTYQKERKALESPKPCARSCRCQCQTAMGTKTAPCHRLPPGPALALARIGPVGGRPFLQKGRNPRPSGGRKSCRCHRHVRPGRRERTRTHSKNSPCFCGRTGGGSRPASPVAAPRRAPHRRESRQKISYRQRSARRLPSRLHGTHGLARLAGAAGGQWEAGDHARTHHAPNHGHTPYCTSHDKWVPQSPPTARDPYSDYLHSLPRWTRRPRGPRVSHFRSLCTGCSDYAEGGRWWGYEASERERA